MASISFSRDGDFDFAVRCVLSGVAYGMAEPGEVLAVAERTKDGDRNTWLREWTALGERCDTVAARADDAGHRASAALAYRRAANYRFAAFYYVLGTNRAADHDVLWRAHRRSFERSLNDAVTAVDRFSVPFRGSSLSAWRFRGARSSGSRPALLIHNGLGSPISDVVMTGAHDAVIRGWDAIAFDGPGQGHACFVDGLGPVDDWDAVGSAVIDAALQLGGIDSDRLAGSGIADGAYLAAVHAATDKRMKALVCDPGVLRPIDGALGGLPAEVVDAWRAGAPITPFAAGHPARFAVDKLVEQWPGSSPHEVLTRLAAWDLTPRLDDIRIPVFVADPDAAVAFANQSAELAARLGDRATLVAFTTEEGAGLDCEIGAPQLRNQRVFDWLDETLPSSS
jgi:hypothetical protein